METLPCACCSIEIDCGEYGDDRDGFSDEIFTNERVLVCHECAPDWLEESYIPLHDRPYEGGKAMWL